LPKKLSKYWNFYDVPRKINKIAEFYMIFARRMPEFCIIIALKIFFQIFGGHVPPCPPSPTPMVQLLVFLLTCVGAEYLENSWRL